jgi:hypothetical protein
MSGLEYRTGERVHFLKGLIVNASHKIAFVAALTNNMQYVICNMQYASREQILTAARSPFAASKIITVVVSGSPKKPSITTLLIKTGYKFSSTEKEKKHACFTTHVDSSSYGRFEMGIVFACLF